MIDEPFTQSTTSIANEAGCDPNFVRRCCKRGWIPYLRMPSGVHLLQKSAVPLVRQLKKRQLAKRGGRYPRERRAEA